MKYKSVHKTISLILFFVLPLSLYAAELDSTNYKIVGATTNQGGLIQTTDGDYSALLEVGKISNNPRNYSTSYKLFTSPEEAFLPAVPEVSCFETVTSGSSTCLTGPSELTTGGMVSICGPSGCYDRARFEIKNTPSVLDNKTVALWELNEASGTGAYLLDSTSNNYDATPTGTTYTAGKLDGARSFNGTSTDYLTSTFSWTPTAFSVEWWLYPTTCTNYNQQLLASSGWNAFVFHTTSTCAVYVGTDIATRFTPTELPANTVTLNQWQHFAYTYDGTQGRFYKNGALIAGPKNQTLPVTWTAFRMGNNSTSTINGYLDQVRISNVARSAQEVFTTYEIGMGQKINPPDTLYEILISEDNFVSDIRYIDGNTFWPESISTHNLSDFLTKADWENPDFNIQGLQSGTTYYIRIAALHGDFTQTEVGPIASATTSSGSVFFDIDIENQGGVSTETAPPYGITFTGAYELIGGSAAITAEDRIWMDAGTNSQGGFAIVTRGLNGGLKSNTTLQTILSATADLNSAPDGFGIQSEYINQDTYPYLGSISAMANYSGSGNSVGIVGVTATKVYESSKPVFNGRMALKVIAKPGTDKTAATDYQESIFFILIPRF